MSRLAWWPLMLAIGVALSWAAHAGGVVDWVKARDRVRCGVSEGIPGFSAQDPDGYWRGIDADFCRAVAAAVLGDAAKVEFVPLTASERFPALRQGAIDLLARNVTWTLTREALLEVQFPGVLFYDHQTFMVPTTAHIKSSADLGGKTVCVEKGTRHEKNMRAYFAARGLSVKPLVSDSVDAAAAALFSGQCHAYSSDAAQLAAMRLRAPSGVAAYGILDERLSKEPLGPVVRASDTQWFLIVRFVLFAIIDAEERGYTAANIATKVEEERRSGHQALNAEEVRLINAALSIPIGSMVRAVQAVGNYGELYERNVGKSSPLHLERGLNSLWNAGGLMFAPPMN